MPSRPLRVLQLAATVSKGIIPPTHSQLCRKSAATTSAKHLLRAFSSTSRQCHVERDVVEQRTTHFGFETVTESEKTDRVAGVFTSVADSYDRMNDLMSFGYHRIWKCVTSQILPFPPFSLRSLFLTIKLTQRPVLETSLSRHSTPASQLTPTDHRNASST